MTDIFLQEPERLKGQPKNTIADLVAARGVLVPQRFANLDEALASGKPIIARSEHAVEYAGPSGLFESFVITEEKIVEARQWFAEKGVSPSVDNVLKLKRKDQKEYAYIRAVLAQIGDKKTPEIFAQMVEAQRHFYFPKSFSQLTGIEMRSLISGLSFSFWENLGGLNRTMVADSAVRERYHLFSTIKQEGRFFHNYSIYDNGDILIDRVNRLTPEMRDDLPRIIDFYEEIRSVEGFDPNHCPLIEFQTVNGENYFLQYHRTRDFEEAKHSLDREPRDGEVKASLVRGATAPEGLTVNTSCYYRDFVLEDEEASLDLHLNLGFTELMARRRRVQFYWGDAEEMAFNSFSKSHLQRSTVFKPELFVAFDAEALLQDSEREILRYQTEKTGSPAGIPLHVVSDGRRAYVKRG